jgi:hypothetical protein
MHQIDLHLQEQQYQDSRLQVKQVEKEQDKDNKELDV